MDIANLPRYEMGRCSSCGDCNREPEYLDSDGQWVKFEDVVELLKQTNNNAMVPCRMCVNGVISVSCRENCEPNSNACLKYYSARHQ